MSNAEKFSVSFSVIIRLNRLEYVTLYHKPLVKLAKMILRYFYAKM